MANGKQQKPPLTWGASQRYVKTLSEDGSKTGSPLEGTPLENAAAGALAGGFKDNRASKAPMSPAAKRMGKRKGY